MRPAASLALIDAMDTPAPAIVAAPGGAYFMALRRDAPFHAFVAGYAIVVALTGMAVGAPQKVVPLTFFMAAGQSVPLVLLMLLALTGIWSLRSPTPLQAWKSNLAGSSSLMAGVLLFMSLCVFMGVFSSGKQLLTDIVPFHADRFLAGLDQALHGGDPWRWTTAIMPLSWMPALEVLYLSCWGLAVAGATLAALFAPALRHLRAQYVWTFLLMWTLLGNVLAGVFMSAGPVFFQNVTGDTRFAGLLDYLARHSGQGWIQSFLWSAYSGNEPGVAGAGISAFPSMHVASATLCALVAANVHRALKWIGIAYCAVILFGSVQLGWHYAVDGYFSIIATIALWKFSSRLKQTTYLRDT
jgi:hypothetical protein